MTNRISSKRTDWNRGIVKSRKKELENQEGEQRMIRERYVKKIKIIKESVMEATCGNRCSKKKEDTEERRQKNKEKKRNPVSW